MKNKTKDYEHKIKLYENRIAQLQAVINEH